MSDGRLVIARRAHRAGVPLHIAHIIAFCAKLVGLRYALAFALIDQESGFKHIFGHDGGGLFPGLPVTRKRYRALRQHLKDTNGSGANGVGLTQATYWPFVVAHRGLWIKGFNVYFGLKLVADLIASSGERDGLGEYNGGPDNPNYAYADSVLAKEADWQRRLAKN